MTCYIVLVMHRKISHAMVKHVIFLLTEDPPLNFILPNHTLIQILQFSSLRKRHRDFKKTQP